MSKVDSFRAVIELWPSTDELAEDVGVGVAAVRKWRQRDRIPSERWKGLLGTVTAKTAGLTADKLASLAAREVPRA